MGFATFMPKFIEYHYRKRASTSGYSGGISKTVSSVIGLLVSGWIMGRWRFGDLKAQHMLDLARARELWPNGVLSKRDTLRHFETFRDISRHFETFRDKRFLVL